MARWQDEMRRPASVRLGFKRGDHNDVEANESAELVEGDIKDVAGALFGMADMAWEMGWRPRGLMGRLANLIESYKLPPETS